MAAMRRTAHLPHLLPQPAQSTRPTAPTRVDDVFAGGHVAGQADLLAHLQRHAGVPAGQALGERGLKLVGGHAVLVGDAPQAVAALHHVRGAQRVWRGGGCRAAGGRQVWVLAAAAAVGAAA